MQCCSGFSLGFIFMYALKEAQDSLLTSNTICHAYATVTVEHTVCCTSQYRQSCMSGVKEMISPRGTTMRWRKVPLNFGKSWQVWGGGPLATMAAQSMSKV